MTSKCFNISSCPENVVIWFIFFKNYREPHQKCLLMLWYVWSIISLFFLYPTKCCITWATVPTTVVFLICLFKQNTILLAHNILTQASYKRMSQTSWNGQCKHLLSVFIVLASLFSQLYKYQPISIAVSVFLHRASIHWDKISF